MPVPTSVRTAGKTYIPGGDRGVAALLDTASSLLARRRQRRAPSNFFAQMRRYVDIAKKCLAVAPNALAFLAVFGIIAQFLGGLVFLVYFWSIGFMPDMDLQTSVAFLIVAALTGSFLLIYLGFALVYPGIYFGSFVKNENLQTPKAAILSALIWFELPLLICNAVVFIGLMFGRGYDVIVVLAVVVLTFASLRFYFNSLKNAGQFLYYMGLSAFFSLVTMYILFVLINAADLDWINSALVVLCIIVLNSGFAYGPYLPRTQPSQFYSVGAVILALFIILTFGPTLIPKSVMHIYKLGNFKASMFLDEKGCTIARHNELREQPRCHFSDVMIHSRLGNTYYVEKDGTSVCFTIPANEVLSWSVAEKQPTRTSDRGTKAMTQTCSRPVISPAPPAPPHHTP